MSGMISTSIYAELDHSNIISTKTGRIPSTRHNPISRREGWLVDVHLSLLVPQLRLKVEWVRSKLLAAVLSLPIVEYHNTSLKTAAIMSIPSDPVAELIAPKFATPPFTPNDVDVDPTRRTCTRSCYFNTRRSRSCCHTRTRTRTLLPPRKIFDIIWIRLILGGIIMSPRIINITECFEMHASELTRDSDAGHGVETGRVV